MSRPAFPPTPASSTDIAPKHPPSLSNLELSFTLPPPAIGSSPASSSNTSSSSAPVNSVFDSGCSPISPTSKRKQQKIPLPPSPPSPKTVQQGHPTTAPYPPIAPMPAQAAGASLPSRNVVSSNITPVSKKRSSATAAAAAISQQKRKEREEEEEEDQLSQSSKQVKTSTAGTPTKNGNARVTLPPPPGRSRKIIQMKPKTTEGDRDVEQDGTTGSSNTIITTSSKVTTSGRKKAAASATIVNTSQAHPQHSTSQVAKHSAATRKTARKTAHSLIERRRRFKMNEEFAVLKSMIPACRGVEMHKLAILQASIEYLRYLEECVERLKKGEGIEGNVQAPPPNRQQENEEHDGYDDEAGEEGEEEDVGMMDGNGRDPIVEGDESTDDGGSQGLRTPAQGAVGGGAFTFVHHNQSQQQFVPPPPPSRSQPSTPQYSFQPPSSSTSSSSTSSQRALPPKPSFITTQNIPQQLLPPPIVNPFTATASPYALQSPQAPFSDHRQHPQQSPRYHHHNQQQYSTHQQPATVSNSQSTTTSPRTLIPAAEYPLQQGENAVDREATHALLLLAGDVDGQGRRTSTASTIYGTGSGGGYTSSSSVPPSPSVGPGKQGRAMSVMDMLSS